MPIDDLIALAASEEAGANGPRRTELRVRLALLAWDGRGDHRPAQRLVDEEGDPVAGELRLQLAIDQGDRAALERLTAQAEVAGEAGELLALGDLWLLKGGDLARAAAAYRSAGAEGQWELELALALGGAWRELYAMWSAAPEAEGVLAAAHLAQDRLGDGAAARALLERAAGLQRRSEMSLPYLLERLLELGDEAERVAVLRAKLGRLDETPATEAERAATQYLLAEALAVTHPEEALELYGRSCEEGAFGAHLALRARARLQGVSGDWRGAAQSWSELGRRMGDPRFAAAVARRAAELWDARGGDRAAAEQMYARLRERLPGDPAIEHALARLRLERGDASALTEGLAHRLVPEDSAALGRWARAAEAAGDPRAVERWQAWLDQRGAQGDRAPAEGMDPRDERLALAALARCHRRAGAHEELIAIYLRLVKVLEPGEAAPYLLAAAALLLEAGRIDEADALLARAEEERGGDALVHVARALCHRAAERPAEYFAALEAALGMTETQRARAQLLREIARMSAEALGDGERAERYYGQALALAPEDPATLHAYARLCERRGQWDLAVEMRERAAALVSGERAALMLCEVGDIHARQLGDGERARAAYERAHQADRRSSRALVALAALHRTHGRHRELGEVLGELLALLPRPEAKLPLWLEIAQVAETQLDEVERAREAYRAALAIDAGHPLALAGFERLCRRDGRWAELGEVLEHAPQIATSVRVQAVLAEALEHLGRWERLAEVLEQRVALLETVDRREMARAARQLAHLYEERLGSPDGAAHAWHRVDEADPEDLEAARALQRIYEGRGRFADLAAAIERELVRLTEPHHVNAEETRTVEESRALELWMRLGEIRRHQLGRPEQAAEAYEQALQIDPTRVEALSALGELYTALKRTSELERVLDLRAAVTADPRQRAAVLLQKGELLERASNLGGALAAYQEAFQHDPANRTAFTSLERVAYRREDWQAAMALYERAIQLVEGQRVRAYRPADLHLRRAAIQLQYLGQPAEAAASYQRVLELDPESEAAQGAIERILTAQSDWTGLVRIYRQRAELLRDDARRVEILRRAAHVAKNKLRDAQQAAELYGAIHAIDPTDSETLDALERHYERGREWQRLVEVLRTRIVLTTSGDEAIKLYLRIGALCEEGLREPDLAIEAYRKILDIAPSERNALDALARLYEATERWAELVEITRRQIRIVSDKPQKALLLFKCGSVMESKFGKDDDAIRYYQEAIQSYPACLPAVHGLRDLYLRREDWMNVIDTLQKEARLWSEDKDRAGVSAHIGQIYLEKLGDEERAITYFEKALGYDQECLPANRALFELYFARADYQRALPLVDMLTQKMRREGDHLARSEFYRKHAIVALETGDPNAAAEALFYSLEVLPENLDSLDRYVELCRAHPGAANFFTIFRELEKIYRERALDRALARVKVGLGSLRELEYDLDAAEKLYLEALKLAPFDYPVVTPLVDLHYRLLRFDIAASVLEHLLEHSKDQRTRSQGRLRVAQIYSEGAMDPRRAARALEALLAEEPGHRQAHFLLAQELYLLERYPEAQKVCERLIELSAVPGNTAPPEELARYYDYLGRIAETQGDGASAQRCYRRAIDLYPGYPPPVLSLARRALVLGENELAASVLAEGQQRAAQLGPATVREFKRGLGRLHSSYGDRRRAIELYREVVGPSASSAALIESARELPLPEAFPPKLALLGSPFEPREAALAAGPEETVQEDGVSVPAAPSLLLNEDRIALAELYMREPDGLERARVELMQVVAQEVRAPNAYRLLAQVYLRAGENERAARVLAILHLLGYADTEDPPVPPRSAGSAPRGALTGELVRRFLLPAPAGALYTETLAVLREALEPSFPAPVVGALLPIDDPGFRACVAEVGRLLGVNAEVAQAERVSGGVLVLDLPRPLVIVERSLVPLHDGERRFLLGRAFEVLRGGFALPLRLRPGEQVELGRILDQAMLPEGLREPHIQQFLAQLPRRATRALERLVASAGQTLLAPLDRWLAALAVGCDRAGLVACDDMTAAARVLARLGGEDLAVTAEGAVALGQLPGGEDLVRFFLSDAYHQLRLGLSAR